MERLWRSDRPADRMWSRMETLRNSQENDVHRYTVSRPPTGTLDGPSKTITVEPLRVPVTQPVQPAVTPEPAPEPSEPAPEREPVPAT